MEFEFKNAGLGRVYSEAGYNSGFSDAVVKAFRKRMQLIRSAEDERDLREIRGNRFEKLKGNRSHQYSMRLNDQWRLILEIKESSPKNIVVVINIEDYH